MTAFRSSASETGATALVLFFLIGGLIYLFGPKIQAFIEKYFNILAVSGTILLVAGFVLIKYLF